MIYKSSTLEFKNGYNDSVLTVINAFLNTNGGTIIIAFDNNHRERISEIEEEIKQDIKLQMASEDVLNWIHFESVNNIRVFPCPLIEIRVDKANTFYSLKRDNKEPVFYKRSGKSNKLTSMKELQVIRNENDYKIHSIIPINSGVYESYNNRFFSLGHFDHKGLFYKYVDLDTMLLCLKKKTIRFVEPPCWDDNSEKLFYNAALKGQKHSEKNPKLFAYCVTDKKDNEAAWKIYSYGKKGLGTRCVELFLDKVEFRKQILENTTFELYEGKISYWDESSLNELENENSKRKEKGCYYPNPYHKAFFENFSFEKYLNLLLLKRDAFSHEHEIRFFLVPQNKSEKKGSDYFDIKNFAWEKIIAGARISSECSEIEKELFKETLRQLRNEEKLPKDFILEDYNVYGKKRSLIIE